MLRRALIVLLLDRRTCDVRVLADFLGGFWEVKEKANKVFRR
jgi:hypothetical protein